MRIRISEAIIKQMMLKEYVTNDMIYLRDYFKMSEEQKKSGLPYEFYYFFDKFKSDEGIDVEIPEDIDEYELPEWLEMNDKETFDSFADYLYGKINNHTLDIADAEYPAWTFYSNNPKLIKNTWLIHFTNDADGIARHGFKYGVSDIEKLGVTTSLGEFEKKYGGYNFAFRADNFDRYYKSRHGWSGEPKYGREAVLFRASGMQLHHYGDEEPQVIFYGNTARNIIPIANGEDRKWGVYSRYNGRLLFEDDDLKKVVYWVIRNYEQYRRHLDGEK